MKIYTNVVSIWDAKKQRYCTDDSKSKYYFYDGNLALCGGGGDDGGGGSQTTQTIQKSDPWEGQQPYLRRGFSEAEKLFLNQAPPQLFQGNMTLPYSPETETALDLTLMRALNGSPVTSAANQQLTNTLNGEYMNNPTIRGDYLYGGAGFNAAVDAATRKITPQVESAFASGGRLNSGLADVAKTQAISDAFASQYGQERQLQQNAFQNERENQMRSMFFAPQVAQQDYDDFSRIAQVGAARESLDQQKLQEQIARWDYGQNAYQDQLARYMGLIQGNYGGTTSGTSTISNQLAEESGGNPLLSGLGGAATGFSIGGPWGAAVGGGLGLLSGLF